MVAKAETVKTSEELVDIAGDFMDKLGNMNLSDAEKCIVISLMHDCDMYMTVRTIIKENPDE